MRKILHSLICSAALLFCYSTTAQAVINIVQHRSFNSNTGGAINLAFLSNVTTGNTVVVTGMFDCTNPTGTATITDTINTYTNSSTTLYAGANNIKDFISYSVNVTGGSALIITATPGGGCSNTYGTMAIWEVSGLTASPYVTPDCVGNAASGTNITCSGALTVSGNSIIFVNVECDACGSGGMSATSSQMSGACGAATPATNCFENTDGLKYVWDGYYTASSNTTPTATGSSSGNWTIQASQFTSGGSSPSSPPALSLIGVGK